MPKGIANILENKVVNLFTKVPYIYREGESFVIASDHVKEQILTRMGGILQRDTTEFYSRLNRYFKGAIDVLKEFKEQLGQDWQTRDRYLLLYKLNSKYVKEDYKQGIIVSFNPDRYGEANGVTGSQVVLISVLAPRIDDYYLSTDAGELTQIELFSY